MVDIRREILDLQRTASHFGVTVKTVRCWANGVGGRRLETVKLGGKVFTTWEAIERFAIPRSSDETLPYSPSDSARQQDYQKAQRELAELVGT